MEPISNALPVSVASSRAAHRLSAMIKAIRNARKHVLDELPQPVSLTIANVKVHVMDQNLGQPGRNDDLRTRLLPGCIANYALPRLGRHARGRLGESRRSLAHIIDQDRRRAAAPSSIAAARASRLSYS
jgi:hypothetical protein